MRLFIVSDLHGAYLPLADFLAPDDILISLGDHLNILDYKDLSGILAGFVSKDVIAATLELIQAEKLDEARAAMARAAGSIPDLFARIRAAVQELYFDMCHALPCEVHFLYGNVDYPDALRANLAPNQTLHEADVLEIQGRRFGLVSGLPPGPYSFGMPGELDRKVYAQRLHDIGAVDVLCVHLPPAIAELSYDVKAGRDEGGCEDLTYYFKLHRPRYVLFGHVHQPRTAELTDYEVIDEPVELINVGCFRDTRRLLRLDPQTLERSWVNLDPSRP